MQGATYSFYVQSGNTGRKLRLRIFYLVLVIWQQGLVRKDFAFSVPSGESLLRCYLLEREIKTEKKQCRCQPAVQMLQYCTRKGWVKTWRSCLDTDMRVATKDPAIVMYLTVPLCRFPERGEMYFERAMLYQKCRNLPPSPAGWMERRLSHLLPGAGGRTSGPGLWSTIFASWPSITPGKALLSNFHILSHFPSDHLLCIRYIFIL